MRNFTYKRLEYDNIFRLKCFENIKLNNNNIFYYHIIYVSTNLTFSVPSEPATTLRKYADEEIRP